MNSLKFNLIKHGLGVKILPRKAELSSETTKNVSYSHLIISFIVDQIIITLIFTLLILIMNSTIYMVFNSIVANYKEYPLFYLALYLIMSIGYHSISLILSQTTLGKSFFSIQIKYKTVFHIFLYIILTYLLFFIAPFLKRKKSLPALLTNTEVYYV